MNRVIMDAKSLSKDFESGFLKKAVALSPKSPDRSFLESEATSISFETDLVISNPLISEDLPKSPIPKKGEKKAMTPKMQLNPISIMPNGKASDEDDRVVPELTLVSGTTSGSFTTAFSCGSTVNSGPLQYSHL